MPRARQARRAPSLLYWETLVEANSTKASDVSDLDTPDLKRNKSVKENDARDEKVKKR